jgi:predicted ATPase
MRVSMREETSTDMESIVGRETEIATLTQTVSGAVARSPRFLVVEGPPGIGKSALLSAAAAAAEQAGVRVLQARANAGESDLPLGGRRALSAS